MKYVYALLKPITKGASFCWFVKH